MDITQLPEEIFLCIIKYLSADDLLSCSLVNYSWRSAINRDEIWYRICTSLSYSVSGEELNHMKNLVINHEKNYQCSVGDLEPLCKWRLTFMRWVELKNNWRNGNYKRYKIGDFSFNFFYADIFGCDNTLLLVFDDSREISVWDIKDVPRRQETIHSCLFRMCSDFVKLCKNYLVIAQGNLLQVFYNYDGGFRLLFRCLFDKDELCSQSIPEDYDITQWYYENVNLFPCDLTICCEQNGSIFVGAILDDDCEESIFHIWDLNSKNKKIQVKIPDLSSMVEITSINFSLADDHLYIMLHANIGNRNSYDSVITYDLNSYKFLEFKLNFNYRVPAFIFYKNFVFALNEVWKTINVWKINSTFHEKIECKCIIEPKCFNVEGSYLLIVGKQEMQNAVSSVFVYSLSDLKCVFKKSLFYTVYFTSLVQNSFLILGGFSSRRFLSLIDIVEQRFLYNIENDDCVFINSTHSKLITKIDSELNLISFW